MAIHSSPHGAYALVVAQALLVASLHQIGRPLKTRKSFGFIRTNVAASLIDCRWGERAWSATDSTRPRAAARARRAASSTIARARFTAAAQDKHKRE